jgi:hypothetical protein
MSIGSADHVGSHLDYLMWANEDFLVMTAVVCLTGRHAYSIYIGNFFLRRSDFLLQ